MPKKVLVVSYFFPPVGGAGVQRVTKFVKYLPEFGWQPIVLTVENPSVPLFDKSLLADVPEDVRVYKARTLEPGYSAKQAVSASTESGSGGFNLKAKIKSLLRNVATMILQPDPQVLWFPAAYSAAKKIIREQAPDIIFATAPPFSSLLLGARLSRKFKIPLVLDYRDEWDISNSVWENKRLGSFSLALQQRMQNYALKSAYAVVATTSLSAKALQAKTQAVNPRASAACIYNGYDAADFPISDTPIERASDRYELAYVGTLWNLTSIAPLVEALALLSESRPELANRLRLVVAGRRTAEQQAILDKVSSMPVELVLHDYLAHSDSVALMRRSHMLALLLSNMDIASRVVPGKIFEYFATTNSILAIAPTGEVWKLLADYPKAYCADPADPAAIAKVLMEALEAFTQGQYTNATGFDANRYERRELAGELASLLSTCNSQ